MRLLRRLADRLLGTPRRLSARAQFALQDDDDRPGRVYRSRSATQRVNKRLDRDGLR